MCHGRPLINCLINYPNLGILTACMNDSSQAIFEKQSISNKMNKFFCSIGKKLVADIGVTSNPLLSYEISINDGGCYIGSYNTEKPLFSLRNTKYMRYRLYRENCQEEEKQKEAWKL